ncbi:MULTISPECIES: PqqD family peptide modification chaperone [unclassified Paenibacillus]|uniref:PqqD family peptide modification chaperone n=1 Tax=unclassified Paenibacillus TaxID=185978 RepID=UPI002F427C85
MRTQITPAHAERLDKHIPLPDLLPMQLIISVKDNLITNTKGEFIVLVDVDNQRSYSFSIIGSRIWQAIDKPVAIGQLIEQLCQRYDWERAACELIVINFIMFLSREKLILYQLFTYY